MDDAERLFAANHHRLFRYFCRAAGSADTARDRTQHVFVRVTLTRAPAGTEMEVRAWLFRIARNLALDHHRQHHRRPEPATLGADPSRPPSQDASAAGSQALAALPAVDREVFLLREVACLGYDEIARACELTPDAVRSRIHRARLQLRERLPAPTATRHTPPRRPARDAHAITD